MRQVPQELHIRGEQFAQLKPAIMANLYASIRVEAAKARLDLAIKDGDADEAVAIYINVRVLQEVDLASRRRIWAKIAEIYPDVNFPLEGPTGFKDLIDHATAHWTETVTDYARVLNDEPNWDTVTAGQKS